MRMYEGKVTFAVVGLGGRASAYLAALREFYPDGHAVVAVVDPDPKKRLRAGAGPATHPFWWRLVFPE